MANDNLITQLFRKVFGLPPAAPAPVEETPPATPAPAEETPPATPAPAEETPPATPAPAEETPPADSPTSVSDLVARADELDAERDAVDLQILDATKAEREALEAQQKRIQDRLNELNGNPTPPRKPTKEERDIIRKAKKGSRQSRGR